MGINVTAIIYSFATWLLPVLAIVATIALWRIGTALSRIAAVQERGDRKEPNAARYGAPRITDEPNADASGSKLV